MLVTSLSNSNPSHPISQPGTAASVGKSESMPQPDPTTGASSSAQPPLDTYTPSISVVPAAFSNPYSDATAFIEFSPVEQSWFNLNLSLENGELDTAQTDLNDYTQLLSTSPASMSALTTPSAQFLTDLKALGSDLDAGNSAGAQSDFVAAAADKPEGVAEALGTTLASLQNDMEQTAQGSGSVSTSSAGQISNDLSALNSLLSESTANTNELVAMGYTPSEAITYANGVNNIALVAASLINGTNSSIQTTVSIATYSIDTTGDSSTVTESINASASTDVITGAALSSPPPTGASLTSPDSILAIANSALSVTSSTSQGQDQTLLESTIEISGLSSISNLVGASSKENSATSGSTNVTTWKDVKA